MIFTALLDLPDVLEGMGFNVEVTDEWEYGQGNYLWTDPHTNSQSYDGHPFAYMVHHTATRVATPPPAATSKANAWIGLWRDGKLYQTGSGEPTIVLSTAGPCRTSSGYGYRPGAWDYTFQQKRALPRAQGDDGSTALNRYAFNVETVHEGDGSSIDPGVLDCVVGLGVALEQMFDLKEMTLGHRSWSRRKIDPYWNGDPDCIVTVQERVAEGATPMQSFIEATNITVEPNTHTTLVTLPVPHEDTILWASYIRVASTVAPQQFVTRFVRDPDGVADHTGSDDRSVTAGKEFISRVWFFKAEVGKQVGVQLWHDAPGALLVEYVQLKRTR